MSDNTIYNKKWFSNAKIGLFTHYTYATYRDSTKNWGGTWLSQDDPRGAADVEVLASALDARAYAQAAAELGAEYVVFTVCHAGFNLIFPSETMLCTGITHKTSRTDAVSALLDSLEEKKIPLVLYMPPNDNHDICQEDLIKMGWVHADGSNNDDQREKFINTLVKEIGLRYQGRIAGFWFDQGGPRKSAKQAVLEHNRDAVVYVNRGITGDDGKAEISDFLVSEYYGQIGTESTDKMETHHSQINMIFGGSWWACGQSASTTAENLFRYTVRVIATDGQNNSGINWACGQYVDQSWEIGIRSLMTDFGRLVKARGEGIYKTIPGKSYRTPTRSSLDAANWGVSTESQDGSTVYLHVMNPPSGQTLYLAPSADGKRFTHAALLNGVAVGLSANASGYDLKLPTETGWDPVDTVIKLSVACS